MEEDHVAENMEEDPPESVVSSNASFEDTAGFADWGEEYVAETPDIAVTPDTGLVPQQMTSNLSSGSAAGTPALSPGSLAIPKNLKHVSVSSEDSWGDNDEEEVEGADDGGWGSTDDLGFQVPGMSRVRTDQSDWGDLEQNGEDVVAGIGNNADAPRVTAQIAARAQADVKELGYLSAIAGASTKVECDDSAVTIAVAIKVQGLNLTNLQREIYALDIQEQILIKIKFDTYYLGGQRPTIVDVGKIPAESVINYDINPEEFLFTWTLKDRLQNSFIGGRSWPDDSLGDRPPACFESLKEMFQRPLADVLVMLEKCGGSEGTAMQEFMNENCVIPKVSRQEARDALLVELENMTGHKLNDLPINDSEIDLYYVMQHNYLAKLILYVASVIRTGNRTCMICDGDLDYVGWKPSVCTTEKCQFQFNNLGLGFSLAHQIRHEKTTLDLYISTLYSCVMNMGVRIKMCYPDEVTAFVSEGSEEHYRNFMKWVTPEQAQIEKQKGGRRGYNYNTQPVKKNIDQDIPDNPSENGLVEIPDTDLLRKIVQMIPSLKEMTQTLNESRIFTQFYNQDRLTEDQYLKASLNTQNPLLHPLLKWLCTSNRAYLRLLKEEERFPELNTPYQFVFANASPDKEHEFQKLKEKVGKQRKREGVPATIQAWHGSGFGNWHSIMRLGLKNLSNTKWMSAGAAYGAGIYLSPNFGTSLGYSRGSGGWTSSELGQGLQAMALCELINDKKLPKPNPHYVIKNEEWVMTRFFFIFPSGSQRNTNIPLPLKIPDPLKHLFHTL